MKAATAQSTNLLTIFIGFGLAFQVGHFFEHAVQFAVWASGDYPWVRTNFCGRDVPYMSPPATALVSWLATQLFPAEPPARQMMVGMEVLHLIGNALFLATIAGVLRLYPGRLVRCAFAIEGAHMCEHIALTLSAYYLGTPIGLSTMFGHARAWWGAEAAVGLRVTFHFAMNLLPMPLVMMALIRPQRRSAPRPIAETAAPAIAGGA